MEKKNQANLSEQKKSLDLPRQKKIMEPLGTKKITQPLGTKKIMQPLGPANQKKQEIGRSRQWDKVENLNYEIRRKKKI